MVLHTDPSVPTRQAPVPQLPPPLVDLLGVSAKGAEAHGVPTPSPEVWHVGRTKTKSSGKKGSLATGMGPLGQGGLCVCQASAASWETTSTACFRGHLSSQCHVMCKDGAIKVVEAS